MSHICKQALLSQSSPAAVGRGRRGRKPRVAPCSGRTGSFIIVASISLQGRAIANKWLAGSQKETIWPTWRTYLHLRVPAGRQQAGRLKTDVQAILFWIPPWNESLLFLDKNAAHLCLSSLCLRDQGSSGCWGPHEGRHRTPHTGGRSPGWHQKKRPGLGLIFSWVISDEFLNLSGPQFLHQPNGCN